MPSNDDEFEISGHVRHGVRDRDGVLYQRSTPEGQELPARVDFDEYRRIVGETWHQRGKECTGFALAAIANYLIRKRLDDPGASSVSRRMLYEMAQLHDGEEYGEGSTLRGAVEGWVRSGVARDDLWPYHPDDEYGTEHGGLTLRRLLDARTRPLTQHRRVEGGDVEMMRDALAHGHVLFTGTEMHEGWNRLMLPDAAPLIERRPGDRDKGGHAFVVVGYEQQGFWIHNSWGPEWGNEGYAVLPFEEWSKSGFDAWVIEAEPRRHEVLLPPAESPRLSGDEVTASYRDMWPHLVVLRDDGRLASDGLYEMDKSSLGTLMYLFGERTAEWPSRRLAIVSDGGYLPPDSTIERYRAVRDHYMEAQIYPIFIVWETSWWQEFGDELATWISRIAGVDGVPEPLDRDNPLVRAAVDRSVLRKVWAELVARSARALEPGGGARLLAEAIGKKHIGTTTRSAGTKIPFELHTCSHGVGDLLSVELASLLAPPIASATVAMPATHGGVTPSQYAELLRLHRLGHLTVVTSGEQAEAIDMFGCVDGSFLEFVADVLAPSSSSLPGLTDPTEAMFEGIEDRVDIVRLPAPDHVSLAWDAAVHDIATRAMLTHETPDPRVSVNDMVELPTDPLALAEARLRSG